MAVIVSQDHSKKDTVTLHDVAREAGVHASTVSRALDPARDFKVKESTRQRIIDVAGRLGYRPHMVARWLQSGRTATVGIVVADLGNTFVTPIIHGVAGSIEGAGMLAIVAETLDDHARFKNILDHMLSRRVDAVVAISARADDQEILESAGRIIPVVIAARPLDETVLRQVVQDDVMGGESAAEHLVELGHRRVAQLRGPDDVANFARRAMGFSRVCRAHGVDEIELGDQARRPIISEGKRLTEQLVDRVDELPTAVFAHNDLMAIGALSVFGSAGLRVPGDVSLVGYNDLPMVGLLSPPLTTVRYPSLEVGQRVGEVVLQLLAGHDAEDIIIPPTFVVRESTRRVGSASLTRVASAGPGS
jgi:LacI family transcriptional regulator